MVPEYPFPKSVLVNLIWAAMFNKKRSFRQDALACVKLLHPPLCLIGADNIPSTGGYVATFNHYFRPGFGAWWIALGLSATIPIEVHWTMTSGWTYPDPLRSNTITPLTIWAFRKIASVYGFTNMPPMPPRPEDLMDRARAVREILQFVHRVEKPVLGLAPEGGDSPGGVLSIPPSGVGRFILHLCEAGLDILPVGAYEESQLCLKFGRIYRLEADIDMKTGERDLFIRQVVMQHIAPLLPHQLRGEF
jgi:hypothetical protein